MTDQLVSVTCITCGWHNESRDRKSVIHSADVHNNMLCPGHQAYEDSAPRAITANTKTRLVILTDDQRGAIAALIENEMNDGSSKYGKTANTMVRLGDLLELFEDDDR